MAAQRKSYRLKRLNRDLEDFEVTGPFNNFLDTNWTYVADKADMKEKLIGHGVKIATDPVILAEKAAWEAKKEADAMAVAAKKKAKADARAAAKASKEGDQEERKDEGLLQEEKPYNDMGDMGDIGGGGQDYDDVAEQKPSPPIQSAVTAPVVKDKCDEEMLMNGFRNIENQRDELQQRVRQLEGGNAPLGPGYPMAEVAGDAAASEVAGDGARDEAGQAVAGVDFDDRFDGYFGREDNAVAGEVAGDGARDEAGQAVAGVDFDDFDNLPNPNQFDMYWRPVVGFDNLLDPEHFDMFWEPVGGLTNKK
jgi:hypothetical protein